MPRLEMEVLLPGPIAEVFDFFCQPQHRIELAPPDWNMSMVDAPDRLHLGARLVVRTRRWGIAQQLAVEITTFEPNACFVEEQREGPFRRWTHRHEFAEAEGGTLVRDRVEYEPPGGILGLLVTPRRMEEELQTLFTYRQSRLKELLRAGE